MIPLFKVRMAPEAKALVAEVLDSGYIGQGPKCEAFEKAFAELVEAPHDVLMVNSCTSAIDLALHLIGVGPGDEVVTTAMTCTATNSPIVLRGATPVWADVYPETGLIDPADVHRVLTKKTKAIVAVDWGGQPCDYKTLCSYGLPVIEDAAHALLATTESVPIARAAPDNLYVLWSFQAIKHLTTGDGGAILVPKHQVDRARLLRWYGLDRRSAASFRCEQNIVEVGYKCQSNDIAAAIGLANLPLAKETVALHRAHARAYVGRCIRARGSIKESAWWLYTVFVDNPTAFIAYMRERGIEASPVHARNDKHTAFRRVSAERHLPGLDWFAQHEVAIPVGWWLSDAEVSQVGSAVVEWFERRKQVRFA
jgi:dTDP-4-amino-4,6-dideoxy-D-glucose/dTDP-4-amino-2,4-dideoxy-beta-L-xylose transaminase